MVGCFVMMRSINAIQSNAIRIKGHHSVHPHSVHHFVYPVALEYPVYFGLATSSDVEHIQMFAEFIANGNQQ